MALQLPGSLTPSKVSTFKECALAFRLSAIDKVPEPTNLQAFKGTVVHRALELLMWEEQPGARTPATAQEKLDRAVGELIAGDEGSSLGLEGAGLEQFVADARQLVGNYFVLEDPNKVRVMGTELRMQVDIGPVLDGAQGHGGGRLRLRGIIDRLEMDDNGDLIVTDYKTGRHPARATSSPAWAASTSTPSCASRCSGGARHACSFSTCASRWPYVPLLRTSP